MAAILLDGKKIAAQIRGEVQAELRRLEAAGIRPGLAVVLGGEQSASRMYVRNKVRACEELGIHSEQFLEPDSVTTEYLLDVVGRLNTRDEIDGILVQLPLPPQVDARKVLDSIDPAKDVDGFHPLNVGRLSTHRTGIVPCTPAGILEILKRSNIKLAGQEAVVVGRSDVVGKPLAELLINHDATVTVTHSKTRNLAEVCRRADVLVAAVGCPALITREFVKPGATVIDVGINHVSDRGEFQRIFGDDAVRTKQFEEKGSVLVGDVHPAVADVAGALTPVPGGVGPLTIAMLMVNTVQACRMRRGKFQVSSF